MAGFTTVRDVGSHDYIDVGLRNAIRNGKVPGPRMLVSVHAIGATGGHCDDSDGFREGLFGHETGPEEGVINGADQARYAVRLMHKYGADVIKTCASGGVLSPTDDVDTPQLTQEELNAIVDEAHALRRKVATHCHGAEAGEARDSRRCRFDRARHVSRRRSARHDEAARHLSRANAHGRSGTSGATRQRNLPSAAIAIKAQHGHRQDSQDLSEGASPRESTLASAPTPRCIRTGAIARNFTKWWTWA